jgi:4'-phosphopantetheinyl transferase
MTSQTPKLQTGQVQVWAVRSLSESDCLPSLYETLSSDELKRAAAFRFEKDKNNYIAARGLLRIILGKYIGKPAEAIEFRYGPQGKPYLRDVENNGVQFNLSHSEDCAVYAVTLGCELGIDVERIKDLPDMDSVARRFFSPAEVADLRVVPSELRAQAFYNCWTRKEAYIKAVGSGLSLALDQFRVSLLPNQPAALLHLANDADSASCWSMHDLRLWDGFVGAVAIPSPSCSLLDAKFAAPSEFLKHLKA